ncbi:MAG: DUF4292 domain-containing protein [Proteobacteria bacterium]|nr:DUF4292 domain-containing protein [Pseudomonadota bacterium]MBU1714290.1 DUF4292 domain-containing protein [Pseudomonadota bacterium]
MPRATSVVFNHLIFLGFFLSFCLVGCVSLPNLVSVTKPEGLEVKAAFKEMVRRQKECRCGVDARASVTLKNLVFAGTIDGYLQAMAPSSLKFVGVNPFGQPLLALTTDGENFRYLDFTETKSIEGSVASDLFQKYLPSGFAADFGFYWIIGRLPPGLVKILSVARDKTEDGYWLELERGKDLFNSMVFFNPDLGVLKRHLLRNEKGDILLDIQYDNYQSDSVCPLPGEVILLSGNHSGSLHIKLADWDKTGVFSAADFVVEIPPGFKQVRIK